MADRVRVRKLVRDHIPKIIERDGWVPQTRTLSAEGFKDALLDKLVEEANEARQAQGIEELMLELADLDETRLAIIAAFGINPGKLGQIRKRRARERGTFSKKIFLDSMKPMKRK
jgi:predicted house-cleaning noncanonical NTP pyrophosphatase (MazG superfamily)